MMKYFWNSINDNKVWFGIFIGILSGDISLYFDHPVFSGWEFGFHLAGFLVSATLLSLLPAKTV